VRQAYCPIPQKSGLKRRWVPLGGGVPESFVAAAAARDQTRTTKLEALHGTTRSTSSAASKTHHDTLETKPSKRIKREQPDRNESSSNAAIALVPKDEPNSNETLGSSLDKESLEQQRQARKAAKREKKAAKQAKKERKSEQKVKKEQDN
jgi:hypothetical protein